MRIKTAIALIRADTPSIFFATGNQEFSPVLLEHSGGFQQVVSLVTKENPGHVGELDVIIRDIEISPIRALALTSRRERTVAGRKIEGRLGTIVGAVEIGLDLRHKPDVPIYVWDEFRQGSDQAPTKLPGSLSGFFRNERREERVERREQRGESRE